MTVPTSLFVPPIPINAHLTRITEYFGGLKHMHARISDSIKFVFLCFTNRSGSNYMAELLASDGRFEMAGENLNFDTVIEHSEKKSFKSFQEYFSFLVNHTAKNGIVSIKVAPSHLELLGKSGILDQIINRSRFIQIERGDKLAQAISHLIAFQTGKFMSTLGDAVIHAEPVFDRDKLDEIIATIAEEYRDFNLFFGRNGIAPAHVIYERLVRDPAATLAFVGEMIGVPGLKIDSRHISLERQAGRVNDEWRKMYLSRL